MAESAQARIRTGLPSDAAQVVGLWRHTDDVLASATDDEAAIGALLDRDPSALLIAEDAAHPGQIVGTLVIGWDGWRGNFYRLAVRADHRRRGVATALVREGESRLVAAGCRRVAAIVALAEAHATGFWSATGYELGGDVGRYVKNLDGDGAPGDCC
jgi:ribosomal protein S18 acetylase RimI-like enzyme